jgi:hypothetical protein
MQRFFRHSSGESNKSQNANSADAFGVLLDLHGKLGVIHLIDGSKFKRTMPVLAQIKLRVKLRETYGTQPEPYITEIP